MKVGTIIFLILLFGCTKDFKKTRELDISLKSVKGVRVDPKNDITIYPNPFYNMVYISVDNHNAEILINNADGDFKRYNSITGTIALSFLNEKSGVYYCEIKYDNKVFRNQLIKK